MNLIFAEDAWFQHVSWQQDDRRTANKINRLIEAALRSPYDGVGKPERLKGDLTGYWSRRINEEHRLVRKRLWRGGTRSDS